MVGIGGGVPSAYHDVRLGDVVVSSPRDGTGGVIQYDFGKAIQDQVFLETGFLNQPPTILRSAVAGLRTGYEVDGHHLEGDINKVLQNKTRLQKSTLVHQPAATGCTYRTIRIRAQTETAINCAAIARQRWCRDVHETRTKKTL